MSNVQINVNVKKLLEKLEPPSVNLASDLKFQFGVPSSKNWSGSVVRDW
jgi:hypothetical protein